MSDRVIPPGQEDNLLYNLSDAKLTARFTRASLVIQKVGLHQLGLLRVYEKANRKNLETGFLYFLRTVEGFWDNLDFLMSLGKGRRREFSHYPARAMLESLFRVEHYVKQKKPEQNRIAAIEIIRLYKRMYDDCISKGEDVSEIVKDYSTIVRLELNSNQKFTSIENLKEGALNPFPEIWELIRDSNLKKGKMNWYFHYRILCEHSHGKLVAHLMRRSDPNRTYRIMMMYACMLATDMIKVVDHHIQNATNKEMAEAILKAEEIVKAPI